MREQQPYAGRCPSCGIGRIQPNGCCDQCGKEYKPVAEQPKCTCPTGVEIPDMRHYLTHEELCEVHTFEKRMAEIRKRGEQWAREREQAVFDAILGKN